MKKKILLLLTLLTAIFGLAACGSSAQTAATPQNENGSEAAAKFRTLDEIKASGKVIIGVFSDKNPFGYVDANGNYQGYDVYFAERLGKDLGVDIEYVSTEPASRVEFLETAKVDIILANFTVTEERAQKVDFALPYMKVALGIVSPDGALITDVSQLEGSGKKLIVAKGTTAETYFTKNHPDVELLKFDEYTETFNALLDGRGDAFSTDNTEVLAWALNNPGYTVGVPSLGSLDTIAPAVTKGNTSLLNWINDEIVSLAAESFFHADYDATLAAVYGTAVNPDELVVEGGAVTANAAPAPASEFNVTVKIGATPSPHAEILEFVAPILAQRGIKLDITVLEDYVIPNTSVEDGSLDANFFQHRPYQESFNEEQGTHIVDIGDIHYEPFGIYPGKSNDLANIKEKAKIAVPNDTTNEARALLLLQSYGLITLKEGAGLTATKLDIVDNPKKIDIIELEAAQLPRVVQDVDFAAINGNYAIEAGFDPTKDALYVEPEDSEAAVTYANIVSVKAGNENRPELKAIVEVLKSDEVKAFISEKYGKSVIPAK